MKKKKILALYLAGAMVLSGLSFEMLSPCAAEVQQAVDINVEEPQQEIDPNAAKLQDVDENAGKTALSNINAYIIVNGGKSYTFTGHLAGKILIVLPVVFGIDSWQALFLMEKM